MGLAPAGVHETVKWEGTRDALPADVPMRLEFELKGVVDLYGFEFVGGDA